ncbi:hypothetical protein RB195_018678 [Necator americanus]|uniref:Reverse transcriptase domain-containing protein n=1 Tax=Necator americanus TaxID=51031 RepID=A0ABR1CCQ5_NECAM
MTICTYNARTFVSDAAIEDLMMQARKIKYDVIGLTETRRRYPVSAVYDTGEEQEAIKKDIKERKAVELAEAANAGKSILFHPSELPKSQNNNDCSPDPRWNNYNIEKGDGEGRLRLLLGSLRQPRPLASSPSEGRCTCHSKGYPFRSPTCHHPELINTLARLFTRHLSECRVPKQWEASSIVLLYRKGDLQDIGNHRPICLLSVIYKLFTRVILNRRERILDEGQPREQAKFRKGLTTDQIRPVSKLVQVTREYKMPLCLIFIDLKKALDTVETEAENETLDNESVPSSHTHDDISATLENTMRGLKWDNMRVKVDSWHLHHFRFADGIVLITSSINHAERMLNEFDETSKKIGF